MGCIRDKETRDLFSYIKRKHSLIKINEPESIEGELVIKSVRKYKYRYEVDVDFRGFIWGKGSYASKIKKYDHSDLPHLSKIKLYRIMRKKVVSYLKTKLSLFGVEITRTEHISKIKWVG